MSIGLAEALQKSGLLVDLTAVAAQATAAAGSAAAAATTLASTLVAGAAVNQPGAIAKVSAELALIERVCGVRPSLLLSGVAGAYYVDDGAGGAATGDLAALATAFGGAFTRSSAAWHHGPGGALTQAAAGVPRRAYSPDGVPLGILLEGASATNKIQNSAGTGAVVGAPGTMPTRWSWSTTSGVGISASVAGTGTEDGFPVTYVRLVGTATGGGSLTIAFEGSTVIPSSSGQYWSLRTHYSAYSGSSSGLSLSIMAIRSRDSSGALIDSTTTPIDLSIAKIKNGGTKISALTSNAATSYVQANCVFSWLSGAVIDIIIGISVPTFTNTPVASSPIITTTGEVSRASDGLTLIPPSSANPGGIGTLFSDINTLDLLYGGNTDVSNCRLFKSGDANSVSMRTRYYSGIGAQTDLYVASGIYDGPNTNVSANSKVRQSSSWSSGGYIYKDSAAASAVTAAVSPVNVSGFTLSPGGGSLPSILSRCAMFSAPLSAAQLTALTNLDWGL